MYNIFGYFKTCNTQSGKLDEESYQYTTRDYMTVYFNNTLASLGRSWKQFKEKAYGFMYDIGAWLYENLTRQTTMHDFYIPEEEPPVKVEEIEMKELNCTPPIHSTSRSSDGNCSSQIHHVQTIQVAYQTTCL